MLYLVILLCAVIVAELAALALQCRNGHPDWPYLRLWRYAHRGYHDKPHIPENSMVAFRRAIAQRFGAELDVHLMADGELAVIHDSSLLRTAGADVAIEDLTAAQLDAYRLEGTEEKIPLLRDVLQLFEGQTPLIIELKTARGNHVALTQAAVKLLDEYHVRYCLESFDPRCLMWLKRHRPEIVRGQLSAQFLRHEDSAGESRVLLWVLGNLLFNFTTRPDFLAYRMEDREAFCVRLCRRLYHVQEINWTVKTKEDMHRAEALGNLVIFEQFDPKGSES